MFKRFVLLASLALALVAAAAPAASADWQHEGTPVEGDPGTIELEGHAFFSGIFNSGVTCENAYFEITIEGPGGGEVVDFQVTNPTTECEGTGLLQPCTPEQPTQEGTWAVSAGSSAIGIAGIEFTSNYANCGSVAVSEGEVIATPTVVNEETGAIERVTLEGEAATGLGSVSIGGTLDVVEPTYGIG